MTSLPPLFSCTLPFPPSVNSLFGNRGGQQRFKSGGYKTWLKNCPRLEPIGINFPVSIRYTFFWPCKRNRDGGNGLKAPLDYLVSEGVLKDDNWRIVAAESWGHGGVVKKHEARVEIEIFPYSQSNPSPA